MKRAGEYVAGAISFNEFARSNGQDWIAMARYLIRRFPSELDEQDVVQELLIGSWQALHKFDPTRGVTPERFCVFNALRRTRRRLHRQARAPEELLGCSPEPALEVEQLVPASQQHETERTERLRQLVDRCSSLKDAVVLLAFFREEDRTLAAGAIYRDAELRRLCRLGNEDRAKQVVCQTLNRVKNKGMKCRNQIMHR